ncbi:ankyrin [Nemania abortiva]|nr:ankyrin [Nemania abortiva]
MQRVTMPTTSAPAPETSYKPDFLPFNEHKSTFRRLYLEEDKSLEKVKEEMERHYGFPEANTKTYEYGLRHLGFCKKLPLEKWAIVDAHIKKRKHEGKETNVRLSDILQPPKKIARILSRNPKAIRVQQNIGKGSIPDLPEGVSLKTPPHSPNLTVTYSSHNAQHIQNPLLDVSAIGDEASFTSHFQQLSLAVRIRMVSDPNSTVQLLASVPSSEMRTVFMQAGSTFQGQRFYDTYTFRFQWDPAPTHDISPVSQLHYGPSYSNFHLNPNTPNQLHFAEALTNICMVLSNNQELSVTDQAKIISWVGMDVNKSVLKAFFSLDQPAVAATWSQLLSINRRHRCSDAFQALVAVGLKTHGGRWIQQHAETVLGATVFFGSEKTEKISQQLLSSHIIRSVPRENIECMLFHIARHLDADMMSKFLRAGASLALFDPSEYKTLQWTLKSQKSPTNLQQCLSLLKLAGLDFDIRIKCNQLTQNVFRQLDLNYDENYDEDYDEKIPLAPPIYFLDTLWISGQHDTYSLISTDIERAKTQILISGLIMAAHGGTDQLRSYLESRQTEGHTRRQLFLETALSIASGLGDVAAIQSFCKAKVDPNARLLLSTMSEFKVDWHPLMRAAGAKQLGAVLMLVEMGATVQTEFGLVNPLSAAIWKPQPLSNKKRNEQLEIIKFFLDGVHRYGTDAMTKAAIPPCCSYDSSDDRIRTDDFVPDEKIIDMLLEAGIRLDEVTDSNKDVLHLAIDRGCNLKTVEFLLSRGAQIHSRPCLEDGKTMLHSACASSSKDRLQIVKLLLRHKADYTREWGGHTILESTLFCVPHDKQESLELFSLLYDGGAQLNGPKERLPTVASNWAPVMILLLKAKAPDALIFRAIQDGADTNSAGSNIVYQYTPLQYAVKNGRLNIARKLLEKGANINTPGKSHGYTALQAACDTLYNVEVPLGFVQFLLDNGADINAPASKYGATALQCAIKHGSIGVFCILLDAGANIHATRCSSYSMESTLDLAAWKGRLDMVDILLRKGAESYTQGKTPYDGAIRKAKINGHLAIAETIKRFNEQNRRNKPRS